MPFIPNAEFRRRAREALKPIFPTALLVALIASLPSMVPQIAASLTDVAQIPFLLLRQADALTPGSLQALLAEHQSGLQLTGTLLLISLFLSPVLALGETWFSLRVFRGEGAALTDVFARLGSILKAFGLSILTALYVVLWELPGLVLSVVSSTMLLRTGSSIWSMLFYPAFILSVVLGVRAMLRVCLASHLLADDPARGILHCMKESRRMMENRGIQFFVLMLSFIGWYLVLYFLDSLLSGIFGGVVGSTFSMLLQLALNVYMNFTVTAYYLQVLQEMQPQAEVSVE